MATPAHKLITLSTHIDKLKQALESVKQGIIPAKHKDGINEYINFLEREIEYHEKRIAYLSR